MSYILLCCCSFMYSVLQQLLVQLLQSHLGTDHHLCIPMSMLSWSLSHHRPTMMHCNTEMLQLPILKNRHILVILSTHHQLIVLLLVTHTPHLLASLTAALPTLLHYLLKCYHLLVSIYLLIINLLLSCFCGIVLLLCVCLCHIAALPGLVPQDDSTTH